MLSYSSTFKGSLCFPRFPPEECILGCAILCHLQVARDIGKIKDWAEDVPVVITQSNYLKLILISHPPDFLLEMQCAVAGQINTFTVDITNISQCFCFVQHSALGKAAFFNLFHLVSQ